MKISSKSRGSEISARAQRIFFCCDTKNLNDSEILINDLLSMDAGMDCVVLSVETLNNDIDQELLRSELQGANLLVLWVTAELLQSVFAGNWPVEYIAAKEVNTPILPISTDDGLFPLFTEKAGAIHGISMSDNEYRAKLKAQLQSFLASDQLVKEIQEKAFTAEMFLSYRKADISEARRFMKEFHDIKGFETISIWYDNFLTAGRNFNYEIEESINKSDAFVLLVTPSLATEGNYVQTTEYPFAYDAGKIIVPVEAVPSDAERFSALYPGATIAVSINDPVAMRDVFLNKLGQSVIDTAPTSARMFYLGQAYLKGLRVERDVTRALEIFERCVNAEDRFGYLAAWNLELTHFYGRGIPTNYEKAYKWGKVRVAIAEKIYGTSGRESSSTASAYNDIGATCDKLKKRDEALEWLRKAMDIKAARQAEMNREFKNLPLMSSQGISYDNKGVILQKEGKYTEAMEWHLKAVDVFENALDTGDKDIHTASCYVNTGACCKSLKRYDEAKEWFLKALSICMRLHGEVNEDTINCYRRIGGVCHAQGKYAEYEEWSVKQSAAQEKLSPEGPAAVTAYWNIGNANYCQKKYEKANEWFFKALAIEEKISPESESATDTYIWIAAAFDKQGKYADSIHWQIKAVAVREKVLGKEHPKTIQALESMKGVYAKLGYSESFEDYLLRKMNTLL